MLSVSSRADWSQDVNFSSQAQMEFCSWFHVYCDYLCAVGCSASDQQLSVDTMQGPEWAMSYQHSHPLQCKIMCGCNRNQP